MSLATGLVCLPITIAIIVFSYLFLKNIKETVEREEEEKKRREELLKRKEKEREDNERKKSLNYPYVLECDQCGHLIEGKINNITIQMGRKGVHPCKHGDCQGKYKIIRDNGRNVNSK